MRPIVSSSWVTVIVDLSGVDSIPLRSLSFGVSAVLIRCFGAWREPGHNHYFALESMYCQRFVLTYLQHDTGTSNDDPRGAAAAERAPAIPRWLPGGNAKFAGDILGLPETERPVPGGVLDISDENVLAGDPRGGQPVRNGGKQGLLGGLTAPGLGEDLDHHHVRRPLEAEPGILGNNLPHGMLGQHVEVVPLRNAKFSHDRVVDALAESAELLRAAALVDVNSYERHSHLLH